MKKVTVAMLPGLTLPSNSDLPLQF